MHDLLFRAWTVTNVIASACDLARARSRAHALKSDLALDLANELAHRAGLVVARALGVREVRHVEGLAAALLDGVLDDFTRADLSHADLGGHDLTGVLWSDPGTRWPRGTMPTSCGRDHRR